MTGKVHCICGVSAAAAAAICFIPTLDILGTTVYPILGVVAAFPGSLLPDIDIQQSKAGSKVKWLSKHLKHRGITHTLLFPALLAVLFFFVKDIPLVPSLIFGFEIGYVAHIVADLFNKKGVPLLWPVIPTKIHVASIKTASKGQQIAFIIFWEVICLLCIAIRYQLLDLLKGIL